RRWSDAFADRADLLIYGCELAATAEGESFLARLREMTNLDIAASTDFTGSMAKQAGEANWVLEYRNGDIESFAVLDREKLEGLDIVLSIEVYAAGDVGDEILSLQVGDQIVGRWTVSGTDASNGNFERYDVNVDNVSVDDVRINFENDFWDPANDFDRNLRVDRIVIDGVTYQSENSAVFSTGTWRALDGIQPGFRESEYLNASGYFQYSSAGADGFVGSFIEIEARGDTGQESMQLLIDGNVVQTYENLPTNFSTYTYQTNENVTADRIQIRFSNDRFDPATGLDRNLIVDRIRINGEVFETEAPTTFSTGFFDVNLGQQQSGFFQNETLFVGGTFEYLSSNGSPGNGEEGSFVLATDFVQAFENEPSVTLRIDRVGGADGNASVQFSTASESATEGSDFVGTAGTLFFADGETSKTVTVGLLQDGVREGTESFSFRLTGSSGASLLAPRTATVNLIDVDQPLPTYGSFVSSDGLQLNRNAFVSNGRLQLTTAAQQQRGSAFYTQAIGVDANTSFTASFAARFDGGQGASGGEGLAFLIQNSPGGLAGQDIGNFSGGLGYNAQANTLGIELDTFQNVYEQYADEITITVNGELVNPIRTIQSPFNLNNGQTYFVWVDYNGFSNNLAVYLSDSNQKPDFALFSTNIALDAIVGDQAYLGFSASTGSATNNTYIESWTVTLDTPPEDPPTIPTGEIIKRELIGGLTQPLNVEWSPDGRNMYVGEKAGLIRVSRDGGPLTELLDLTGITNNVQDRGLVDFEVHPDFFNNPYIYLNYTVDPPEVNNFIGNPLAGPDGSGNRAGRLIRFTLDASTNYTTIVPDSGITLLGANSTWGNFNAFVDSTLNFNEPQAGRNPDGSYLQDFINSDSRSHTVGGLVFGADGALYVGIGDGASFNATDPRATRVQDIDSLSGKILRIDPNTGQGLPDNPFYNGDPNANRSKVYQLGLRNPWRLAAELDTGQIYIGETGLVSFEEINAAGPGANFGWPYFEGGQGVNIRTPSYQGLPQAQAFYNSGEQATPAFIAQPHTNGTDVIVLGTVADGLVYGPQYDGDVFYLDFASGTVRRGDVDANGNLASVDTFTTGANFVVDLQQGPDGYLYYVDIVAGSIGRFEIV
ncbi:MAG: PQQ-dependent sugar dehydrogenase, partial [Planctomycetota bacterium]